MEIRTITNFYTPFSAVDQKSAEPYSGCWFFLRGNESHTLHNRLILTSTTTLPSKSHPRKSIVHQQTKRSYHYLISFLFSLLHLRRTPPVKHWNSPLPSLLLFFSSFFSFTTMAAAVTAAVSFPSSKSSSLPSRTSIISPEKFTFKKVMFYGHDRVI